jgi:hypothetical protein
MACTPEVRREINRRSAQRSTGPRTADGKARARLSALKHGLRAEEFALLGDDQEALKRLTDEWVDYYQPRSPGEHAVLDRCARYHAEAVADQVRKAEEEWHRRQEDEVEALKELHKTAPAEAVRKLNRSARGCFWMLEQWRDLLAVLDRGQTWVVPERQLAARSASSPGRSSSARTRRTS